MGLSLNKFRKSVGRPKTIRPANVKLALGRDISALRMATVLDKRTIVRIDGKEIAVIPLRDLRRLEWFLEQEEEEERQFDRIDVEEAERILSDPAEVTIPYEQIRRELGLGDLSD
jgi:hypothetical protein